MNKVVRLIIIMLDKAAYLANILLATKLLRLSEYRASPIGLQSTFKQYVKHHALTIHKILKNLPPRRAV